MSFVIRTVSHTAEGREIVRAARVEGERLTIGRSADNAIRLTDLGIAPFHAEAVLDGSTLNVTAAEGLDFVANGRTLSQTQFDVAAGADLRFGAFVVRFSPGLLEDGAVALQVERYAVGDMANTGPESRLFSLGSVMPSRRAAAWLLVAAVLAYFLIWPVWSFREVAPARAVAAERHPDRAWSPGPLSAAHANLETDCRSCHVEAFVAVRDASCKSCHTAVHDHADPRRIAASLPNAGGWDRAVTRVKLAFNLPPGRCVDCHVEHEGRTRMPFTAQRFCSDCHQDLKARLGDTKLPNAGDFSTAHPEFTARFIAGWSGGRPQIRRASLAARPVEDSGLKFPHDLHLSKGNAVAQMARRLAPKQGWGQALECKNCHVPEADGVRFANVSFEKNCGMCHNLAFDRQGGVTRTLRHGEPEQAALQIREFYRGRLMAPPASLGALARQRPGSAAMAEARGDFIRAPGGAVRAEAAVRQLFGPRGTCGECHRTEAGGSALTAGVRIHPVAFTRRYVTGGWFDHKAHSTETCASCHKANMSRSASDVLLPDLKSCRTCHGGERARAKVPSSCAMCHDYHRDNGAPAMTGLRGSARRREEGGLP